MPDFIEYLECPECERKIGRLHDFECSHYERSERVQREEAVIVRYIRERRPVPVTDAMAKRLAIYEYGRTEGFMDWAKRAIDIALNGGHND